jgi:predicted DNA-binding transcriptional regulator YafY
MRFNHKPKLSPPDETYFHPGWVARKYFLYLLYYSLNPQIMPQNKDFSLRTEIIDECLRNRFRKWTLEKLVEEVNNKLTERYNKTATKRTIQSDIKFLIEEKNAPIAKKKDGNLTYFSYMDNNFSIKNLPINEEDVNLLRDAIKILSQVNEFQILRDVEDVINKLQNTISTNGEANPTFIQFERHTISVGTHFIDNIMSAIKGKTALKISYQSFKANAAKDFIFHTYLLKEYRNRWFAIGREDNTSKITILALDRIKALKPSQQEYIANDLFNPDTYYNNLIGITFPDSEGIQEIKIKVCSSQAPYILTKPIHHTQEIIKKHMSGDLKIKLQVIDNYELRSVLLSYGADIEVLEPESLRVGIKEIFSTGVKLYS